MLANEEIRTIISALGAGIGADFDAGKLRYGRIIIMTDADVDGSHIRTFVVDIFSLDKCAELVENGYLYIAQPPLYKIKKGRKEQYLKDTPALETFLLGQATRSLSLETALGDVIEEEALDAVFENIRGI